FHQVTASTQAYGGLPTGTRAVQLPDPSKGPYFLKVFGQPQADTACECERSQEANLAQSLHLLNSSEVQNKIAAGTGRAAKLAADKKRPNQEKIKELYRWVYSREPDSVENKIAMAHLAKHEKDVKVAWEDIIWALINTKEFLFNH
ncbi:MAG TPA: S-layer protein, partial [Planctomycetaceae bacterium]|nr:S-layer protein [Planctomycetaceae bacterium]